MWRHHRIRLVIFLLSFCFIFSLAQANNDTTEDDLHTPSKSQVIENQLQDTKELTSSLVKMTLSLLLVCTFAVVILRFLLPRIGGGRLRAGGYFDVLYRFPLETRKTLYIVRVGKEYHLLGVSEQSINFLAKLNQEEVEEAIEKEKVTGVVKGFPKKTFLDWLEGIKKADKKS